MTVQGRGDINHAMTEAATAAGILAPEEEVSDRFAQEFGRYAHMMQGFLSHNPDQSNITGTIAYFFAKAVEYSIGYDLYEKLGVFSVSPSPDDIGQIRFRSNLPAHLDELVNGELKTGIRLAEAYLARTDAASPTAEEAELAYKTALLIADTYARGRAFSRVSVRDYPNAMMLTPNEYRKAACEMFLPTLEKRIEGCDILEKDFSLDPYFNVIARYQQGLHFILFAVEVAPREPKVLTQSFYAFVEEAKRQGASAYIISLGVRAKDEKHFQDGVLLRGEQAMYRLNDFKEIDIPKSEERLRQEAELQDRISAALAQDAGEEL